jgi:hypothetical protein
MAMMVRFAVNRARKQAAVFFGGDEHGQVSLPAGWEELVPRDLIRDEAAFQRWIAGSLEERLRGLAPAGFACLGGLRRP